MDKTQLLNHLAATPEDRLLLSHALDQLRLCQRRGVTTHTGFLSPAQWSAVEELADQAGFPAPVTLGGYADAERRRCLFLADWQTPEDLDEADYIHALRLSWYAPHPLSHRDLLGALMGLGLKREAVGDLLVGEGSADLLLLPELSAFVMDNLQQAGREKLHIAELSLKNLHFPTPKRKLLRESVPSLRLDAVLCAAFGLSRSKAAELIRAGKVSVNYRPCLRADLSLEAGALLSCRGAGKAQLTQVGKLTRKGRISVSIERFV